MGVSHNVAWLLEPSVDWVVSTGLSLLGCLYWIRSIAVKHHASAVFFVPGQDSQGLTNVNRILTCVRT